jgi:hypothetical protein
MELYLHIPVCFYCMLFKHGGNFCLYLLLFCVTSLPPCSFHCRCLQVKELLSSAMDEVTSSLHLNDGLGIQNLILSAAGLGKYVVFLWERRNVDRELRKPYCSFSKFWVRSHIRIQQLHTYVGCSECFYNTFFEAT